MNAPKTNFGKTCSQSLHLKILLPRERATTNKNSDHAGYLGRFASQRPPHRRLADAEIGGELAHRLTAAVALGDQTPPSRVEPYWPAEGDAELLGPRDP